jgi:hypothetical protein
VSRIGFGDRATEELGAALKRRCGELGARIAMAIAMILGRVSGIVSAERRPLAASWSHFDRVSMGGKDRVQPVQRSSIRFNSAQR